MVSIRQMSSRKGQSQGLKRASRCCRGTLRRLAMRFTCETEIKFEITTKAKGVPRFFAVVLMDEYGG